MNAGFLPRGMVHPMVRDKSRWLLMDGVATATAFYATNEILWRVIQSRVRRDALQVRALRCRQVRGAPCEVVGGSHAVCVCSVGAGVLYVLIFTLQVQNAMP